MNWIRVTKILLASLFVALVVYDIAACYFGGVESTISRVTLAWAKNNPIIPFFGGVIVGHVWWAQHPENDKKK